MEERLAILNRSDLYFLGEDASTINIQCRFAFWAVWWFFPARFWLFGPLRKAFFGWQSLRTENNKTGFLHVGCGYGALGFCGWGARVCFLDLVVKRRLF